MKFRHLSLFFALVFCLFIVMFCQTEENEIQSTQTPEQLQKYLIHVSEDADKLFSDDARKKLITRIDKFISDLKEGFREGEDEEADPQIGDFLEAQHVVLEDTTRNYKRIKKGAHFYRLFNHAKRDKALELELTKDKIELYIDIKHVTVDTIEEERYDDEGNLLNLIARVIFKYHVREMNNPLSKNQGGGGSGEFGHRNICTWF